MKKLLTAALLVSGIFSLAVADAAQPLQVAGRTYGVTIYCQDDVGGGASSGSGQDYCTQGNVVNDTMIFSDNGSFSMGSFQGGVLNLGASGSYSQTRMTFSANYQATPQVSLNQLSVDRYRFDIRGFDFLNVFILGRMNISYETLTGIAGYQQQNQGIAYFVGTVQQ
jgi:hypothetical protein